MQACLAVASLNKKPGFGCAAASRKNGLASQLCCVKTFVDYCFPLATHRASFADIWTFKPTLMRGTVAGGGNTTVSTALQRIVAGQHCMRGSTVDGENDPDLRPTDETRIEQRDCNVSPGSPEAHSATVHTLATSSA